MVQFVHVFLDKSDGFVQPGEVSAEPFDLNTSVPFAAVLCGSAERLQVAVADKDGKEVCRPAQNFRSHFDVDTRGPVQLIVRVLNL